MLRLPPTPWETHRRKVESNGHVTREYTTRRGRKILMCVNCCPGLGVSHAMHLHNHRWWEEKCDDVRKWMREWIDHHNLCVLPNQRIDGPSYLPFLYAASTPPTTPTTQDTP